MKNKFMNKTGLLMTFFASIIMFGCAGNMINKESRLYNSNSNSKLSIIRGDNRVGSMVATPVYLNNELIAKIKIKYYSIIPIVAGTYKIKIGEGDNTTLYLPQEIDVVINENSNTCIALFDDLETGKGSNQISQKPVILNEKECKENIELVNKIE